MNTATETNIKTYLENADYDAYPWCVSELLYNCTEDDLMDCNDSNDLTSLVDSVEHELIDSAIDIYYYDLEKWMPGNTHYIDDARDEGLIADDADIHQQIQAGQYMFYREQMNECIEAITNHIEDYKEIN